MLRLNLGSSDRHDQYATNVDRVPPADVICDLEQLPWPWETSSVDEIIADDLLEHLWPNKKFVPPGISNRVEYPIIALMNEIWRVLKPGGTIAIFIPTTDGRGAFQDPTHKTFWNRNSFFYFTDGDPHRVRFGEAYGIKARFKVLEEKQQNFPDAVVKLNILLEAVK